ncbi:MAG: protocatechuate 3,4-dioxygenase, partial [Rhodospirillaceae bacterium]|nr:protocatechuate 3,4-dioxygenase [Rhodospirillaceae bacterium]
MARIVLGVGTSHSPMLSLAPEHWDIRTQADRDEPAHPY